MEYFRQIPIEEYPQQLMVCNFRAFNKKGELRNYMQESYFIKIDPDGTPLAALGFITDISHIRNDNRISHAIYNDNGEVYRNHYYAQESGAKLSPRQIEIIKLMCDGFLSKEIADRLNISERTVDNHKQNIRKIINTRNVAEVIKYAINNGIVA